jgi:hypothetical protein
MPVAVADAVGKAGLQARADLKTPVGPDASGLRGDEAGGGWYSTLVLAVVVFGENVIDKP